ncbi:MAG: helix-turn-helix transcriptional regulator [Bradyrhizobium sp.]|jgi:phage repressor protein C with HTH and peptisase S24 domain
MLTHAQIWTALDRLAARAGLSPSGLARKAGLDPTTFNRSKRMTPEGRSRWPSTESLAKSLAATGTSMESFVHLIDEPARSSSRGVPMIDFAQAVTGNHFDDAGHPIGNGWDELAFPAIADESSYALKIAGDSMAPIYRDGNVIVVSPAATVHKDDRVLVKTRDGQITVREFRRRTPKVIELRALTTAQKDETLPARDVMWMARIVWASQ